MKPIRFFVTALLLMTVSLSSFALTTNADANNYKNKVLTYLKEEGYLPKFDEDGDIKFKYQGETYYISVSAYDNGYYVSFLSLSDLEGLNTGEVLVALDQTEKSLKFVRCYTTDDYKYAVIQICLYCETVGDFTRMFGNAMEIIPAADKRFIDNMVELMD